MQRNGAHQQIWESVLVLCKGRRPRVSNPKLEPCSQTGMKKSALPQFRNRDGSMKVRSVPGRVPATKRSGNVWDVDVGWGKTAKEHWVFEHPAVFPEKLAARCVETWSNEGDTVLDPFAGSGTTLKVAVQLGRRALGVEISPKYAALAQRRLDEAKGIFI